MSGAPQVKTVRFIKGYFIMASVIMPIVMAPVNKGITSNETAPSDRVKDFSFSASAGISSIKE